MPIAGRLVNGFHNRLPRFCTNGQILRCADVGQVKSRKIVVGKNQQNAKLLVWLTTAQRCNLSCRSKKKFRFTDISN